MNIVVAIIRHHDSFAFLQRMDGAWTFPSGKVEAGESLNEALIREVMEEVGLSVVPAFNLGSRTVNNHDVHYKVCQHLAGDLSLREPEKFLRAQWVGAGQLLETAGANLFEPVRNYILDVSGYAQPKI